MDEETIKDRRAQLTALTDQIDAAVKAKLMEEPRRVLEVVADELSIEHAEMGKSALVAAILSKIEATTTIDHIEIRSDE